MQKSLLKQDSQFSILHPRGGSREKGDGWETKHLQETTRSPVAFRRNSKTTMTWMTENLHRHLSSGVDWKLRSLGKWLLERFILSHPHLKSEMPLWIISLWDSSVFHKVCFAWQTFLSSSCSCLERANQESANATAEMVRNYCMLTSFEKNAPTFTSTNIQAHMFATSSVLQQKNTSHWGVE